MKEYTYYTFGCDCGGLLTADDDDTSTRSALDLYVSRELAEIAATEIFGEDPPKVLKIKIEVVS